MAQMTYLEIVNKVLKRLRETQVTTIDYSEYSSLISEFVNDAKNEVEDAWNWSAHTTSVSFRMLADGDQDIVITAANTDQITSIVGNYPDERARLYYDTSGAPLVFMTTQGKQQQCIEMNYRDLYTHRRLSNGGSISLSQTRSTDPIYFAFSYSTASAAMAFSFRDDPIELRTYIARMYCPQLDLEDDDDLLLIPWRPVVHLAILYALDERGEEIGEPGSKAWMRFEKSLGDAIALDALSDQDKTMFKV